MDWRGRSVARGYKSEERGNGAGVKVREFKKVRAVFLKGRIFSKNQNCPVSSVPNFRSDNGKEDVRDRLGP
jgi:hypothetical protein